MGRKVSFFVALFLGFSVVSCHFTEEIHLEEDGSGSIALLFDGSALMSLSENSDAGDNPVRSDSVIRLAGVLDAKRDSIRTLPPQEQARLEKMRPYELRMISDEGAGELKLILSRNFADIAALGDTFNAFQDAGRLQPGQADLSMQTSGEGYQSTEVAYSFRGNTFTRRGHVVDSALHQQRLDSLKGSESFLSESTYKLELHFPRKIESATLEGATLSVDGKTLFYEVELIEYLRRPELLDLEVILQQ